MDIEYDDDVDGPRYSGQFPRSQGAAAMIFIICPLCRKANGHRYGCSNASDLRAALS